MFVTVDRNLMRSQDYDACLRNACDQLYKQGIQNWIYYDEPRHVELLATHRHLIPVIDYPRHGIDLRDPSICI